MSTIENLVWAEKYRPRTLEDAILPESTKAMIRSALDSGNVPHFLFSGSAGTGKTTLARIIANELNADLLFLNSSLRGIDSIRMDVLQYASTVSFSGGLKFVVLDEFDGSSKESQQSLRGIIEEFPNTRFIFTCNFKNKIIEAIHSRCVVVDFKTSADEAPKLQAKFFKRILTILELEKVVFDKKAVADLLKKYYPDFRRTLNELQRYGSGGAIDSGILTNLSAVAFDELLGHLKTRSFAKMRQWVGKNPDIETQELFKTLYSQASDHLKPECIPMVIILLGSYSYRASMVADQELQIAACMAELMQVMEWK